jgi:small subunit ribosomal protein S16
MLKIRLRRMGKTHAPFYRVVVSDSRRTPTAASVEEVGHYNPRPTPPDVKLDLERLRYWQGQGALLSPTVKKLVHRVESGKLETEVPKAEKKKAKAAAAAAPAVAAPAEKPAEEKVDAAPAEKPAEEKVDAAPQAETEATAAPEQKTEAAPAEEPAEPKGEAEAAEEKPAKKAKAEAAEEQAEEAEPAEAQGTGDSEEKADA